MRSQTRLSRVDEFTFFNRGQTNPELYPEVEKLRGDRARELNASTVGSGTP